MIKLKTLFSYLCILSTLMVGGMLSSCNSDEMLSVGTAPRIFLDNEDGVYEVKTGRTLTISPTYENAIDATFTWKVNGTLAGTEPSLTISWDEPGEYYIDLTVTTSAGSTTAEMRVDVLEPGIPYISLPFSGDELIVRTGTIYDLTPEIANSTEDDLELTVSWTINGKPYSNERTLHFSADEEGDYNIEIATANEDGKDQKQFTIKVMDQPPFSIFFPAQSYFQKETTRYTFPGRPIALVPIMENIEAENFLWTVDGTPADCDTGIFIFTPEKSGTYLINVTVENMATASVTVVCVDSDEDTRRRAASASSSAGITNVFEWVPGPGQFIGETQTGGMTGNETTHEAAIAWALNRLKNEYYVSLGAFGGYIIVGFDHSIANSETDYDFSILGNAFFNASTGDGGSNEPGIIYVSQDVNGNGLPDDEWYELRGSETGKAETLSDYAVTYYRPAAPKMNVQWTDCLGQSGTIDYLAAFHRQDYYYPAWINADSYTLRGTRLQARTVQNPSTGMWDNNCFDWGYSDNMGSDTLSSNDAGGGEGQRNGFLIKNAMLADGSPINLKYIDFIKVQTGINSKAGWLGEVSTEVFGFYDLNLSAK